MGDQTGSWNKRRSLGQKFREFFSGPTTPERGQAAYEPRGLPLDVAAIAKTIDLSSALPQRLARIQDLLVRLRLHKLAATEVEALWLSARDLVQASQPAEARHLALQLLQALIFALSEDTPLLRTHFFQVLRSHDTPEDTPDVLRALAALTRTGSQTAGLEGHVGPFVLELLPDCAEHGVLDGALALIGGLFQHGYGVMETDMAVNLIICVCRACNSTPEVRLCRTRSVPAPPIVPVAAH